MPGDAGRARGREAAEATCAASRFVCAAQDDGGRPPRRALSTKRFRGQGLQVVLEEEEEEESLFKADAVNEEDSERDRATQEEEEEDSLFKADAVNEEDPERDRTLVQKTSSAVEKVY